MTYVYKYYPAALGTINKTPKNEYLDLFQENLDDQFYNSTDWWTIEQETSLGSGEYENIDVRITRVIDPTTGEKVSNDYKKLLFPDVAHTTSLGWMFKFDNNYWVTVNADNIKTLASSVTVRRCNNVLRWFDSDGGYYEVPCCISYLIKENRDYSTAGSALVIPSGMIECVVQYNSKSNLIKANQRFLFGNSLNFTAYRVEGGGINNYINTQTSGNTTVGLITLSMSVDYVNSETDDIVNGVANAIYDNDYTVELNQTVITGSISQTRTLQAVVKLGDTIVDRNVVWSSSNTAKATVNSSGVVTMVANGVAIITCALENNSSINDVCSVTISATPADVYQIVYSPESNEVLEGAIKTWTVSLYKNGTIQGDTFIFSMDDRSVPVDHYEFLSVDGNHFLIQNNEMYLEDYLAVTATSGIHSMVFNIYLRGKW